MQIIPIGLNIKTIDFQINNFDANGYHPFEGCYPCELNCPVVEV